MSEVLAHFVVASFDWPHVRVKNKFDTTIFQHRVSDDPLCSVCFVTLKEPQNEMVEYRFPRQKTSIEDRIPIHNEAVDPRIPKPHASADQRLSILLEEVDNQLPRTPEAVDGKF